jgi:hypothetical protein
MRYLPVCNDPAHRDVPMEIFGGSAKIESLKYDTFNGVSAVLINSEKGSMFLSPCRDKYFRIERELDEAVKYNMAYRVSFKTQ